MKTWVVSIVVIALFLSGVHRIEPGERASVKRWGAVVARPGAGLWIGWPRGIDQVERVSIATPRRVVIGAEEGNVDDVSPDAGRMLTGDRNIVVVRVTLEFGVGASDQELDDFVQARERVDAVLMHALETSAREWIGSHSVDEVLVEGRGRLGEALEAILKTRLEPLRLGVVLYRVSVSRLSPPRETAEAFESVRLAKTSAIARVDQGEREAGNRRQEAATNCDRWLRQSESECARIQGQALAESDVFRLRLQSYKEQGSLRAIWWSEMGTTLMNLWKRGRIAPLDDKLGPNGLDVIVPGRKER